MISLIVARARGGAIGRFGDIPWSAPEDMRMFQRETLGGALIMGRRTWESLPKRPLPRRLNCVVSRDAGLAEMVRPSVPEAIRDCRTAGYSRLYGIGGASIYAAILPFAHRLLITEVDLEIEGADTWFPEVDLSGWAEIDRRPLGGEGPPCLLRELVRTDAPKRA